jgi:hypothetical protein
MEVYAAKREASWLRQGITKAGRPGLAVAYYPISTRAAVTIAPIAKEFGLRPSDGILLSVLPDIKVEQDYLTTAIVWEEYGGFKLNGNAHGVVGGFCGGIGGAIIEAIVTALVGWIVYRDILCWGAVRVKPALSAEKEIPINLTDIWATSVWAQALHRHTNYIIFEGAGGHSGPGCETQLFEIAFLSVAIPINGANVHVTRQHRARMNASQSPLDAEWQYEVANAAMRAGLDRHTGGDVVLKIAEKLKGRHVEEPYRDVREFYDMAGHKPLPPYEQAYLNVKEEISAMGLNFD